MPKTTITVKRMLEIEVTPELVAEMFCELSDDEQAQVFIECEKIGRRWEEEYKRGERGAVFFGMSGQFWNIGSHLKNCECSSENVRDLIRELHAGVERGNH